ncbi:MAG: SMP-30/gluconolactonase/LRE family protein [Chitinophagaceae bacterium]|nr:MAG: SMP-30/gluconolactonase/LRE family protein [Chitinophagaceae bacterium]
MKKNVVLAVALLVLSVITKAQENAGGKGRIEFIADELSRLINKDAKIETIAEGFQFTEGPLWFDKEKMLLFSDVPANTIYKWTEAKGKEVYLKPSGYTDSFKRGGFMGSNGLALTNDGQLLICQHGDRRIARMSSPLKSPQPAFVTVAGDYNGKKLNSPNDLFLTKDGDLYFTDPSYGFEKPGDPRKEIAYQGVYRLDKAGKVTLLIDSIAQPNGIGIFPDGKTLLVSNSADGNQKWYIYEIAPDGPLRNGRIFYDVSAEKGMGGCDGFKIDKSGNVFASGPGGIWIFSHAGKLSGKIKIDGVVSANCALTADGKTLFITASNYVFRLKLR